MSKLGILGATAVALSLAVASPSFARGHGGHGGHFGGGSHFGGGHFGGGHFGSGLGFAAGLAAGSALGYGYGGYYDPNYYGDSYAYDYPDDGYGYPGYIGAPAVAAPGYVVSNADNVGYCEQRYRSYDPASGTYLGYDGMRHPCP